MKNHKAVSLVLYFMAIAQVLLILGWTIPGWPLNGAPWGVIFLPIWVFLLFSVVCAFIIVILIGYAVRLQELERTNADKQVM